MSGADEVELVELERRWLAAVQDRDIEYLDTFLAKDFTLTTGRADAEVRLRDEYLAVAASRYTIKTFGVDEIAVRNFGDVAVLQTRYWQRATFDGEDRSGAFRMTDVLVRNSGRWRAALRHSSVVETHGTTKLTRR